MWANAGPSSLPPSPIPESLDALWDEYSSKGMERDVVLRWVRDWVEAEPTQGVPLGARYSCSHWIVFNEARDQKRFIIVNLAIGYVPARR